ncbi:MAG: ABC transporter substrate-binding protein [Eubacteriales bacterium]|nr:ABC transporter substrate-binding protein [Eubacteriales bacterium]
MFRNFAKLLAFLMAALMLFSFVGCDQLKNDEEKTEEEVESPAEVTEEDTAEAAEVEDQAEEVDPVLAKALAEAEEKAEDILAKQEKSEFPMVIEDSADREVEIPAVVERVVSLGPNMTEAVFALGCGDRLVGRTDYCDYPEEVSEIESIGTLMEPNLEKIIELKPDVVLASTHVAEEFVQKLDEVGIPCLFLYEEHELDGLKEMFFALGKIFDKNEEAAKLTADVMSRIEYVEELTDEAEEPTVYYVVGFGEGGDYTAGGDTFINDLLESAGLKNIAEDVEGWSFSAEKLIELDPDYILLPAWADGLFQEQEPYKNLTAVKEGRVIIVDANIFSRQGPRVADAVEFLFEQLHPALFEQYKLFKKVA